MTKGAIELELRSKSLLIAGVDEVGRGCLAGAVYACAVILDYEKLYQLDDELLSLIRDSKKLSTLQRKKIIPVIKEVSLSYAITSASVDEVDSLNVVGATFLAMNRALCSLSLTPDMTLVDGNAKIKGFRGEQKTLVKGDSLAYCIAAASILAKEARDDEMKAAALTYPQYGFDSHVGYGTKKHIEALALYGVLPIHRKSFAPVQKTLTPSQKI